MPGLLAQCANFTLAISGIWIPLSALLAIPWVQRQALYLHWLTLAWGLDMDSPEKSGFMKSQVAPFYIKAKDGESLYAWLIAPVTAYARNVEKFRSEKATAGDGIEDRQVFKCLANDPEARLIIYFHGNSATLAQGRRTQEYRVMASGLPDKLFVLSFDYRGFGKSTGRPSETGCTLDAIAAIRWAIDDAGIPPSRIVLHAQSMGTAIATAAAHYFVQLEPRVEFAGLLLSAGFTDALAAYQGFGLSIGVAPLMGLKYWPALQRWFGRRLKDTWKTSERLADYVRKSSRVRVSLMHAQSDGIMPWKHSEELFAAVVEQLDGEAPERDDSIHTIDLGEGGYVQTWSYKDKIITKEIVKHGGHDTIMTWSPISLAILRTFELEDSTMANEPHMDGVGS